MRFLIQYCYYTDVRAEEEVDTTDELAALVIARGRDMASYVDWCRKGEGFHIIIKALP